MKKTIALLLALVMMMSMLAACGNSAGDDEKDTPIESSSDPVTEESTGESTEESIEETTEEPTEAGPRIVEASALNKHDNGWFHNEDGTSAGVYFNLWTNDVPVDETWSVRYVPTGDNLKVIRDGVTYDIGSRVLKFSNTEWFLVLDLWLMGDFGQCQSGDVLVLSGDYVDEETGWGIHFETTYISLKGENGAVFSLTPPEA